MRGHGGAHSALMCVCVCVLVYVSVLVNVCVSMAGHVAMVEPIVPWLMCGHM